MRTLLPIVLLGFLAPISNAMDAPRQAATAAEKKPTQLELLEQMEAAEKAIDSIKQLGASMDAMLRVRKMKCLKAFGYEPFCQCLNEALAVGLEFEGYVAVITRTKEELKYNALSKDDKALVDSAVNARNNCITRK